MQIISDADTKENFMAARWRINSRNCLICCLKRDILFPFALHRPKKLNLSKDS